MKMTTLGRSGLQVSRIAFGTWSFGGDWGSVDVDAAQGAIRYARELGVNLFDTAQGYGNGEGRAGARHRPEEPSWTQERDRVVIATKGGIDPGTDRDPPRRPRVHPRRGGARACGKLGVEHIDLYQVHWPDPDTPFSETAGRPRQELVEAGKIRHVGVSNYDVAQMREFSPDADRWALQPPYHLFRRGHRAEVLPYTRENDIKCWRTRRSAPAC